MVIDSDTSNKVKVNFRVKQVKDQMSPVHVRELAFPNPSDNKKYKTFTKAQKLSIISELKKALWPGGLDIDWSADDMLNQLKKISKSKLNEALERILSIYSPSSLKAKGDKQQYQKDLKQWRKQIKIWITGVSKPEGRGNVRVIPLEKTTEFKERMMNILQGLPSRNFDLLRERALETLKEVSHDNGASINENTFSKHFWYDFMKANPDIERIYSSLPRNCSKARIASEMQGLRSEGSENCYSVLLSSLGQQFESSFGEENFDFMEEFKPKIEEHNYSWAEQSVSGVSTHVTESQAATYCVAENWQGGISPNMFNMELVDYSQTPAIDFYKNNKMIVETEENEMQMMFFREFCKNGM